MKIKAPIKIDKRTKDLAKRIVQGEIAVINHKDIDEVAADSLVEKKVKAIINANRSISGKYPNKGPSLLCEKGILIIDNVGCEIFEKLEEGDVVEIEGDKIYSAGRFVGQGEVLDCRRVEKMMDVCNENLSSELDNFIDNTIEYAKREKSFILGDMDIPKTKVDIEGRHVLVVVRGQNYKEDLNAITSYIEEVKPVLVGVDGGADALLEFGYSPDIIVGDMDSVSDSTLKKCSEIIVHAYPDGRAPGLERISDLGLDATVFPAIGTSEDIAMLIAYDNGAKLIVALGTHSNIIDFLEKGRKGMSSTFLVRMKIGSKLIDAKGVSLLYRSRLKIRYIWGLVIAALFPVFIVASISPQIQQIVRLIELKMKFLSEF